MQNNADEMKTQTPILRHLPQERGWTLIELLIGITVTLGVLFAAFPIIDGAANTEARVQQAAGSVGDARVFSDQVLRDLRPADITVGFPSPTALTVDTSVRHACGTDTPSAEDAPATKCRVTYSCSEVTPTTTPATYSCTRQESDVPPGGSVGPAVTMVSGLSRDDVFSYVQPGDRVLFVGVKIILPNQQDLGGDAITLEDGTALRNAGT